MAIERRDAESDGSRVRAASRTIPRSVRDGISSLAVNVVSALAGLAVAVLLARALGPEGYGSYSYVIALVTVVSVPAQLGLPNLLIRETANARVHQEWGLMRGLWRWSSLTAGSASFGLAVAGLLIGWIFSSDFTDRQLSTFYWGLVLIPLVALGNLRGAALSGLQHVILGQLPERILRPLIFLFLIAVFWIMFPAAALGADVAMGLNAFAALVAFLIGAWFLRNVRPEGLTARPVPEYRAGAWIKAVIPLAFVAGMFLLNSRADIICLGIFMSPADVGIYRVVVAGGAMVVFALNALNMIFAPRMARLHAMGEMEGLQRLATMSARMALLLAIPVLLLFVFFGKWILARVFGAPFADGYQALVILGIGQLANAGMGSVGTLLNMTGHERDTARAVGLSAAANIVLNLVLIPILGINGAALATTISMALWNIVMWRAVYYRLGIRSAAIRFDRG